MGMNYVTYAMSQFHCSHNLRQVVTCMHAVVAVHVKETLGLLKRSTSALITFMYQYALFYICLQVCYICHQWIIITRCISHTAHLSNHMFIVSSICMSNTRTLHKAEPRLEWWGRRVQMETRFPPTRLPNASDASPQRHLQSQRPQWRWCKKHCWHCPRIARPCQNRCY